MEPPPTPAAAHMWMSAPSTATPSEYEKPAHTPLSQPTQIEWEISSASHKGRSTRNWSSWASRPFVPLIPFFSSISSHISPHFGPTKRFPFNLRPRTFILSLIAIVLVLALGLGLGLGLGLKHGHDDKSNQDNSALTPSGTIRTGDLTYYNPGMGACGIVSADSEMIVAISRLVFDQAQASGANPNMNPLCGRKIRAKRGNSAVVVTVVDRCVGCKAGDLDMSSTAFKKLADMALGRVNVEWTWIS